MENENKNSVSIPSISLITKGIRKVHAVKKTSTKKTTKKTGEKKSIKEVKEPVSPINQRGKDNLNKFIARNEKLQHADNRTRLYQLRITFKEKNISRTIERDILPEIRECESIIKNNSADSLIYAKAKQRIEDLREQIKHLQFRYKFRFAIFKTIFDLVKSKGFGIELTRQYLYSNSLPYNEVIQYLEQFKAFLKNDSVIFESKKIGKELQFTYDINRKIEDILSKDEISTADSTFLKKTITGTNEPVLYSNFTVKGKERKIKLTDLFKIGIYRETKNKQHHLRQVSAKVLLKNETYPDLKGLAELYEGEQKQSILNYETSFCDTFNSLVNLELQELQQVQTDKTIWDTILSISKGYIAVHQLSRFEFEDWMQDCYIHLTLDKSEFVKNEDGTFTQRFNYAYSLNDDELRKKIYRYFDERKKLAVKNNRIAPIEVETDDLPILNIPFHLNINTAYQMEQSQDFQLFKDWINSRKFIAPRSKEIMLFILENLNLSLKEVSEHFGMHSRSGTIAGIIKKLSDYAKRFNDFGIYEFLMKKYFPSYEVPKILKGKAIKQLKARHKVVRNIGQAKEMIKGINYELSNRNKINVVFQ